jgi:hypothetical protein
MARRCHQDPYEFRTVRSIFGHAITVIATAFALAIGSAQAVAGTPREHCRAVMYSAPRVEAIATCDRVVAQGAGAEDMWAAAAVRTTRAEEPTMDDLIRADLLAGAASRLAPGEPWGALAQLDLAQRWGDRELIDRRVAELERVAPADPRTAAAVERARPPGRGGLLLGWCVVLLGCAATIAHSLWRLRARRHQARTARAIVVAAALVVAGPARTAIAERFPINDGDPEHGVPTPAQADARPLDYAYYLQELAARADAATARGDHAAAVRYERALVRAVPDSSIPEQRLCASLQARGDRAGAIVACGAALGLSGVRAEDFVRFGDLVLGGAAPSEHELDDVEAAARHLIAAPDTATRVLGLQLECRLAVHEHRVALLEQCTAGLAAAAPRDAQTIVFQWSLAVEHGDRDLAEHFLGAARAAGVSEAGLARMQVATDDADSSSSRLDRRVLLVVFALAFAAAFAAIWIARSRRVRAC